MPTPEEYKRIAAGPQNPQEHIWWHKYAPERLEQWRQVCDPLADACTAQIRMGKPRDMLDEVIARAKTEGGAFQAFLDHCNTVPRWVDFSEMEKGREAFRRYAAMQGLVLLCSSLVEGYTFYKPAAVLVATGRLQTDVAVRLFETGQLLHNIVGRDGMRPGGLGQRTCMEVRLLHSAVRQRLWASGKWDTAEYDEPINQEDMAATVLGFDFMVVRGLRRLGIPVTDEEHTAMHYYWRYVGYLLGVDEALLTESPAEQEILALQLTSHLYKPTPHGEALVKALVHNTSTKSESSFGLPEDMLFGLAEYLGGPILARDFHIRNSFLTKLKIRAFVQFVKGFSAVEQSSPDLMRKRFGDFLHWVRHKRLVSGLGGNPDKFAFQGMD